jgi:hypothetical protein
MFLTSGLMFKSFAEQSCFSFSSDLEISNSSGRSAIVISGEFGAFNLFSFNSGKIFDCKSRFVNSYSPNEALNISGDFCSGTFGYFVNNKCISLNSNVCSSNFSFENLSFSTTGAALDFSVDIWGDRIPSCVLSFDGQFITGSRVTGYLKNNSQHSSQSFKIFSADTYFPNDDDYYLSSNLTGLKIKQNNSGQVLLDFGGNSAFETDQYKRAFPISGDLSLETNFGSLLLPIYLDLKAANEYNINLDLVSSGYTTTGNYWEYSLQRQACSGTRFEFQLREQAWYDPFYQFSESFIINSGYDNGNYSGSLIPYNISKSAYIGTGYLSGAGCSGSDIFNTKFDILYENPSGIRYNRMKYTISGIDESFLFDGVLTN